MLRSANWAAALQKEAQRCCAPTRKLVALGFFVDSNLDGGGDVAEDLDGDSLLADDFHGFAELYLALVHLEALRFERFGNIAGSNRAEHLIVLAGLAGKLDGNAVQ